VQSSTAQVIEVKNAAGRIVQIAFAADPDITIIERLATEAMPNTSIEIKGGTDVSNVHNRIGEAEKSHLKAKAEGFTRFWTIVRAKIDAAMARKQSPTTTEFFNLDEIQSRSNPWRRAWCAVFHFGSTIGPFRTLTIQSQAQNPASTAALRTSTCAHW
jgi:hypothetical protein